MSTCPGGDLSAWGWGEGGADATAEGAGEGESKAEAEGVATETEAKNSRVEAEAGDAETKIETKNVEHKTGAVDMLDCCRPLEVTVYKLADDIVLEDWKPPVPPEYKGLHGISLPTLQRP